MVAALLSNQWSHSLYSCTIGIIRDNDLNLLNSEVGQSGIRWDGRHVFFLQTKCDVKTHQLRLKSLILLFVWFDQWRLSYCWVAPVHYSL